MLGNGQIRLWRDRHAEEGGADQYSVFFLLAAPKVWRCMKEGHTALSDVTALR